MLINLFIGVSVATLFVAKMTMDKEKHSSGFKGSVNTYSSSRDRTTNNTSASDLVKKLEDRERELDSLKKQKESNKKENKSSNEYYQLKYEKLYHENMIMKNELFELKNLIQRFKKSEGSTHALNEKSKDENQSDSSSSDD